MWSEFESELNKWVQAGMIATFWWRDDDAITDTKELDVLLNCANGTPIALAVIPDLMDKSLAHRVLSSSTIAILQHGWRHNNHSPQGAQSEYPPGRDPKAVAMEFLWGARTLGDVFGPQYLPVFAPPWHGFDDNYLPLLLRAGLQAISRKGPRPASTKSGLIVSNVHCVPIRWGSPPSFGSDDEYLTEVIEHLKGRRTGTLDPYEPTGILTHHLAQNAQSYAFMEQLTRTVAGHPGGHWLTASQVFNL